jgi:hypothetical protein
MRDSGRDCAQLWTPRDSGRARAFYEREGWSWSGDEVFNAHLRLDLVRYERRLRRGERGVTGHRRLG